MNILTIMEIGLGINNLMLVLVKASNIVQQNSCFLTHGIFNNAVNNNIPSKASIKIKGILRMLIRVSLGTNKISFITNYNLLNKAR